MCNMLIVYSAGQIDSAIQYYRVCSMPTAYFMGLRESGIC